MDQHAIFRHARELQQARTLADIGRVAATAVRSLTRYRHSWLGLVEPDDPGFIRIFEVRGDLAEFILDNCPRVPIADDAMVSELLASNGPVVVEDARVDPRTNKAIVELLGNRTIVNVPMLLGTRVVGTLGCGTFGDEGVVAPTETEVESLVVFSVQLAAAIERVRGLEQQQRVAQEHARLERRLEALQRVEMMGLLASGVAHDLNNLLMVARTNLALLRDGRDPEAIADADAALERAASICAQLLTLGRTAREQHERVDLDARLEATLRLVRPAVPRTVQFEQRRAPHPLVEGNPTQLDQALANLVLNARDAVGDSGTISVCADEVCFDEVTARKKPWARAGRFARVSVEDTGSGIPPELMERIFDPLMTTKKNGTGLGLAVVSRVVQQHHGFVHCESRPGRTVFELYFPAADALGHPAT